jgi:hypothetical protein
LRIVATYHCLTGFLKSRNTLELLPPAVFGTHAPTPVTGVASQPVFPYLEGMEVPFTAEQEAQLARMATKSGTDAAHLVKDAAL